VTRILAFAGSARRDSFNKKLLALAAASWFSPAVSVGGAHSAFAADGTLADAKLAGRLDAAVAKLVSTTTALLES